MFGLPIKAQHLRINEIMSSNFSAIADDDGEFEDWAELYNGTDSVINLKNYWFSDDGSQPDKWKFPEVLIQPDAFLLIFTSGKDKVNMPYIHTNFRISISGEPIILSDSSGQLIDAFPPVALTTDNSYGRHPDGCTSLVKFMGSSPGESNNLLELLFPFTDFISFSAPQGLYSNPFNLSITNTNPNARIYYTLNGSDPDTNALLYSSPLMIKNNASLPNNLSTIPTTSNYAPHPYHWRSPTGKVFKGNVVKARAFNNGIPTSDVKVATYLVSPDIFTRYSGMPIISIVIDSLALFDYNKGIYVPGKMADDNPNHPNWWGYGNFFGQGMSWERQAHITLFEDNGSQAFSQKIGIRVHGNSSRALPLKTLRLYARNLYGQKTINYRFFPWKNIHEFRRIQLSSSGNDFPYNMCADAISSVITRDFNFEKQDYRPAVVFINGEFWGIHNIRDRLDENYLEYTYNITPDNVDFLYYWGVASLGDAILYNNMTDYIRKNDLSEDVHYDYVANIVDIDNFIDYIIAKQYTAVYDWPGNNVNLWRPRTPEGKFRCIFFDNDQCFSNYSFDAIAHSTMTGGTTWPNPDESTFLLRNLLRNRKFSNLYLQKFEYHLTNSFSEQHMLFIIDSIASALEPVMNEHINRWQYPLTLTNWKINMQKMREFAQLRPCYMKQHLYQHFNITDSSYAATICPFSVDTVPSVGYVISTYPNPAKDVINVELSGYNDTDVRCSLYDMTGRTVYDAITAIQSEGSVAIPVINLSYGLYVLRVEVGGDIKYMKVMME